MVVFAADSPQAWHRGKDKRVDNNRVRECEKTVGAHGIDQCRNRYHSVGSIEVAADEEPRDNRAEAPAAESPFVQKTEVTGLPARSHKAENCHQQKKEDENGRSRPINHCRVQRVFR